MHLRIAPVVSTSALALSIGLLCVSAARAQAPCEERPRACPVALHSDTARGLALATGQRATALSTSALAYNPAAMVLGKLYHLEGSVDYMPAWDSVALGAAVVDSSTSKIGAGIAFRGFISGEEGLGGIDGRIGLAVPVAEMMSVGLGLRYLDLNGHVPTASGATRRQDLVEGFTMDASIRVQPSPIVQFAALAVNFIDRGSAYAPVLLGGSVALTLASIVSIGSDLLFDVTSFGDTAVNFGFSTEVLIAQVAPVRLGYSFDVERELHILAGGAGYTDQTVGLDISVQQELSRGNETRVMGSFRYYVQ